MLPVYGIVRMQTIALVNLTMVAPCWQLCVPSFLSDKNVETLRWCVAVVGGKCVASCNTRNVNYKIAMLAFTLHIKELQHRCCTTATTRGQLEACKQQSPNHVAHETPQS
jgi:hypothetical protein